MRNTEGKLFNAVIQFSIPFTRPHSFCLCTPTPILLVCWIRSRPSHASIHLSPFHAFVSSSSVVPRSLRPQSREWFVVVMVVLVVLLGGWSMIIVNGQVGVASSVHSVPHQQLQPQSWGTISIKALHIVHCSYGRVDPLEWLNKVCGNEINREQKATRVIIIFSTADDMADKGCKECTT